jgi:hypothetical protein
MSIRYLIPDLVIGYIEQYGLFENETSPIRENGKLMGLESSGQAPPAFNFASKG